MAKLFNFRNTPQPAPLVKMVKQYANSSRKSREYKRRYRNLAHKLELFEKENMIDLTTNSFNYQTFEDLVYFLFKLKPYRIATLVNFKGSLHRVLTLASREGHKCDFSFVEYPLKKEEHVAIFLTPKEVETLFNLNLKDDASLVRDRFIVGCCSGLRYSDYSRLGPDNFTASGITIKTQKTGEKVLIPVHWMITEIMKRNGGNIPVYMNSLQNFNKIIKNVCKKAKINDAVLIERTEGSKVIRKNFKKYELVSSHTARRSFATNMYLAGVATAKIMLLTGHQTEQAFFKYIRIGKQENANELSTHPFFKKNVNLEDKL